MPFDTIQFTLEWTIELENYKKPSFCDPNEKKGAWAMSAWHYDEV